MSMAEGWLRYNKVRVPTLVVVGLVSRGGAFAVATCGRRRVDSGWENALVTSVVANFRRRSPGALITLRSVALQAADARIGCERFELCYKNVQIKNSHVER